MHPGRVVAVVGHQREQVGEHIRALWPDALLAVQETQEGTGHAVRVAMDAVRDSAGPGHRCGHRAPYPGDVRRQPPLLEGASLRAFTDDHVSNGRAMSILSGEGGRPDRLRPG